MRDRILTTLAAAALLSTVAAAPSSAQTTFEACYVPDVGAMYLINLSGLPTSCLATDHVQVSWTEGGGVSDHGELTGLADDDHPEYVREGEASGGDLSGTFPGPSVAGLQGRALSSIAPSDGQVLTWNGTNTVWEPQTSPTGVTDHGNLTGLGDDDHGQYLLTDGVRTSTDGFAVEASFATGAIPTEGPGARMMWYAEKAAFRAGEVGSSQWDDTNVGLQSTAFGEGTTAGGRHATAMGAFTTASGSEATAMGNTTTASGLQATAMGSNTTARARGSLVIGRYNVVEGDPSSFISTDPLFVAGNGTSVGTSNALTLLKNGNMTIAGTLTESSDARLKTDVEPLGTVLEDVRSLQPTRFQFREGTGHPTDAQIGLLAQEVQEVFPELVTRDSEGYLSLAYPKLTAVLVKALQEQQAQIEEREEDLEALRVLLEERERALEALRTQNARINDRLNRLEATVEQLQDREP